MKRYQKKKFTLIEVVIVIVILVTLASIATPMYMNYVKQANVGAAKTQLENFSSALQGYQLQNKKFPEGDSGLQALIENVEDLESWQGPYLRGVSVIPKDPWGNDYVYRSPGEEHDVEIVSYGADGEPGGEGDNADIIAFL
ncbi:MAG: type II secretion system major pseudopilin GspG [Lentisphaeria bacterium]|nr:type II secretion system major pseudopilin GspG [Lentisphaeria bacterium]